MSAHSKYPSKIPRIKGNRTPKVESVWGIHNESKDESTPKERGWFLDRKVINTSLNLINDDLNDDEVIGKFNAKRS